jgi:hypothetical protein
MSTACRRVSLILFVRQLLKVARAVVSLPAVLVVDRHTLPELTEKGVKDETMNVRLFRAEPIAEIYLEVTPLIQVRLQDLSNLRRPPILCDPTYLPRTADREMIARRYCFPDCHIKGGAAY